MRLSVFAIEEYAVDEEGLAAQIQTRGSVRSGQYVSFSAIPVSVV